MNELPSTLGAALSDAANRWGDAAFILHGDAVTSYRELDQASRRAAAGLLRLGIVPGDRIGLLSLNRIEWLALFFGAVRIGAAVVAMSPRYRENELGYMVRDSELEVVVTVASHEGHDFVAMFDRLAPELPKLRQLVVFADGAAVGPAGALPRLAYESLVDGPVPDGALEQAAAGVGASTLAMVIYTSGTTGRPKGAGLTHGSMLASSRAQAQHMRIDERDLVPIPTPLNHVGGITCGVLSMMAGGGRVDLMPEFKADEMLRSIQRHRPTIVAGVPTMMTLLLMKSQGMEIDFSPIRLIFVGGSNSDATLLAALQARMPGAALMNLYGLSESSGAIVLTPWDASQEDLMATIGRPIGDAELQVVDSVTQRPLPAGQVGELCFKGCGVVPGYIGAARQTEAFLPGGWLRTGDLGEVDSRGVISLRGRAKEMYIQGGFNVYPAEVEAFIARHPAVMMVAGIGVPDPVLGEVGRYFVIRKPGSELTEAELRTWCAEGLADYKLPRQFVFRDELPLTPAGKIQKAALKAESLR